MSCIICEHVIEEYEDVDGETYLLRKCKLTDGHVNDDYTCKYDTYPNENFQYNTYGQ